MFFRLGRNQTHGHNLCPLKIANVAYRIHCHCRKSVCCNDYGTGKPTILQQNNAPIDLEIPLSSPMPHLKRYLLIEPLPIVYSTTILLSPHNL